MAYQFEEINVQINRWVVLIITFFSILGNMVNIAIFIRPVFNHHVCSWYLFSLATNNCVYSVTVLMYRILTDGFQIPIFSNSFPLCQFISFMNTFCTGLSHYLIVFTAIDRWAASSTNVRHLRFNNFQVMPWVVLTIIVFCAVVAVSSAVVTEFGATDGLGCAIRATTIYNQFYLIAQLVLFAIIAPILMIIFTRLTIQNRKMIGDLPITVSKCRKMEYHLTQIFLLLVTVHIVLNLLEWIEYLILFRPNMFGSYMLIQTMIRIPIYSSFAVPIIWYLILGIEFRRELGKMIPILAPLLRRIQVNTTVNNNAEAHSY
ncbi:unnamed protein product [Rotaria socialis]|uniref:G-protein coupled receptors family 1 profile domain-containing protein n=1 Tax=Rotaria socialis TaxID=392032 RepID=A0A818EPK7_9BILA|nr:unnamed protein product [Rotaria socialis]CAF3462050.1 unnamed protein product [Rotaria socialis]CAF3633355.1 unnamed protein product [Rotaria socialis]CAF4249947.1 unnamed protein product [Rotaria socialis]CAF4289554.1 unnamed protein product [Rotaria socialis]